MNIDVSHESPISVLPSSTEYNDYDYALVHLFETYPEYYSFFKTGLDNGREVYLDNSIFELGHAFDPEKYKEWITRLNPSYYIIPDSLEDMGETIFMMNEWVNKTAPQLEHLGNTSGSIGVVQGKNWTELVECYRRMDDNVDMIAISFDYSYYLYTGFGRVAEAYDPRIDWAKIIAGEMEIDSSDPMKCAVCKDKMKRYSTGRIAFIQRLIDEGIWNWQKPHHLLGCSLPREFRYYVANSIYNIKSIDTSNPVVAAILGYRYNGKAGLVGKPSTKLADLIEYIEDDAFRSLLEYNTRSFKEIIGR